MQHLIIAFWLLLILAACTSSENLGVPEQIQNMRLTLENDQGYVEEYISFAEDGGFEHMMRRGGGIYRIYRGEYIYTKPAADLGVVHAEYTELQQMLTGTLSTIGMDFSGEFRLNFSNAQSGQYEFTYLRGEHFDDHAATGSFQLKPTTGH